MPESIVMSLHGIRTSGAWQKTLTLQLNKSGFTHAPLDYGFFNAIKLIRPSMRRKQVDWFRDQYIRVNQDASLPSVIAHSLGTYLVAEALLLYPQIKLDAVILCGSIVRTDFPWDKLIQTGRVKRVLNQYGQQDIWAKLACWFIRDAGPSGADGFDSETSRSIIQQCYQG